jgi:hypothetical protein
MFFKPTGQAGITFDWRCTLLMLLVFLSGCRPRVDRPGVDFGQSSTPSAAAESKPGIGEPLERKTKSHLHLIPDASAPVMELFDGKTLDGWQATPFGGEGECRAQDGVLVLEPGSPLTGVTSTRTDLPSTNYEIELEARKIKGIDFFCGLTFPVADSHCSLIIGGWAGSVVGLSMLDDQDANNNETRRLKRFEKQRWYKIRLRVTSNRIVAWIDDEQIVDQDIVGRRLGVRNETLLSRPLGICSFETQAEIRQAKITLLTTDH